MKQLKESLLTVLFYEFCWNILSQTSEKKGDIRYFLWKFDMIVSKSAESSIYKFCMNFIRNCQQFSFKSKGRILFEFLIKSEKNEFNANRKSVVFLKEYQTSGWLLIQFFISTLIRRWQHFTTKLSCLQPQSSASVTF